MDVSSADSSARDRGITLRQAALTAGVASLLMLAAPYGEFVYGQLVVPMKIQETAHNIMANRGLFVAGIFAYFITFICDVVVAWALYILLAPVNRSLSLLAAWFRLVYTVIAFVGLFNLATVFRMLTTSEALVVVGSDQLLAQAQLLLSSSRHQWGMGLVIFGIHLWLLGHLVYRSGYIPRILGILLEIAGLGYVIYYLSPYLYPDAKLGFISVVFTGFGELIFTLWLLLRGWRIPEPSPQA